MSGSLPKEHKEDPTARALPQSKEKSSNFLANLSNSTIPIRKNIRPIAKRAWSQEIEGVKEKAHIERKALEKANQIILNSFLPIFDEFTCECCEARHFDAEQLSNHYWLTSEEAAHTKFKLKKLKLSEPVSTILHKKSPMITLTTQDREDITSDLLSVCDVVGSTADGRQFTEIRKWFIFAKMAFEVPEGPVIPETHAAQAFALRVCDKSDLIHFERRLAPNEVLNIVVLNRFCLASV